MRSLANWPWPKIMAHRCGGALAPENTLVGMQICAMSGGGGVEFDVMLSGSGTPVLIHDETLERTTSGQGKVATTNDDVLFGLDAGVKHHRAFVGTRIPRFAEAIEMCRLLGLAANVEIKPAVGFERATGAAVAQMAASGWAGGSPPPLLSSFSEAALAAALAVAPALPRALLAEQLPIDWRSRCEKLATIAINLNHRLLDAATVRSIKTAGYRIATYTVNDLSRAKTLLEWGVDTVITDRPDLVRA